MAQLKNSLFPSSSLHLERKHRLMDFTLTYKEYMAKIESYLFDYIKMQDNLQNRIYDAMLYSLKAGGKRIRPVLALACTELLDGSEKEIVPYACALEFIHTYSLIHDDLPCMDNDDFRRGKLTSHKVYGEAIALLAGDALLNLAYETITDAIITSSQNTAQKLRALKLIAEASGTSGMIGGQVIDMESGYKKINPEALEHMHRLKTGALIRAAVLAPALIFGASEKQIERLALYAGNIGLAFQIKDDIMDVESSFEIMGKPSGSDEKAGKTTYVSLYGIKNAEAMLNSATMKAIEALSLFGSRAAFLVELALYIQKRKS